MMYTTASVAEILGVHPNTLKLWQEQGIVPEPERDSKNRKLYSDEQVDKLKKIAAERREAYQKRQAGV